MLKFWGNVGRRNQGDLGVAFLPDLGLAGNGDSFCELVPDLRFGDATAVLPSLEPLLVEALGGVKGKWKLLDSDKLMEGGRAAPTCCERSLERLGCCGSASKWKELLDAGLLNGEVGGSAAGGCSEADS